MIQLLLETPVRCLPLAKGETASRRRRRHFQPFHRPKLGGRKRLIKIITRAP